MESFYTEITQRRKKRFALLIDPDTYTPAKLEYMVKIIETHPPDLILVGGSLVVSPMDDTIRFLKERVRQPVFLFPGNVNQLSDHADGILFLSLITGRNPEFLIGNHVLAAPHLVRSGIEVIPTGYMLIENGRFTSVEYMSNTRPIPYGKTDIAVATAQAGELLGLRLIYLEAGSGATKSVGIEMIRAIRQAVSLPVFAGGGIRTTEEAERVYEAGADLIVIGNALEEYPDQVRDFARLRDRFNEKNR